MKSKYRQNIADENLASQLQHAESIKYTLDFKDIELTN